MERASVPTTRMFPTEVNFTCFIIYEKQWSKWINNQAFCCYFATEF